MLKTSISKTYLILKHLKPSIRSKHKITVYLLWSFVFLLSIAGCSQNKSSKKDECVCCSDNFKQVKVSYKKDKYAGWPANWGMWNWGNEILVGYTYADYKKKKHGHTYDPKSAVAKFSRSLDGGLTWKMEDGYTAGITQSTWENNLESKSISSKMLNKEINFTRPNFAFTFRMRNAYDGGTAFYYTYDRGHHWQGPYELKVDFPGKKPAGIVSRTDYLVESNHEMTAFITVGFREGDKNWRQVACIRTVDGAKTWKFLSWIGENGINSIMPSSVRLGTNKILTIIRRTKPPEMVSFLSNDNGFTWHRLQNPVAVDANGNPPALIKLRDGKLCLVYGLRAEKTMPCGIGIYATFSSDDGKSWSNPIQIRGKDDANWDIGYSRIIQRPDGKLVAVYYYNNAEAGDPYRYIAATIFDPNLYLTK